MTIIITDKKDDNPLEHPLLTDSVANHLMMVQTGTSAIEVGAVVLKSTAVDVDEQLGDVMRRFQEQGNGDADIDVQSAMVQQVGAQDAQLVVGVGEQQDDVMQRVDAAT